MQIQGIVWVGTRTANFDEMVSFVENVLGAKLLRQDEGVVLFSLANGDVVEVFAPDAPGGGHPEGVAPGFLVDDVARAREEMQAAGAEVGDLHSAAGWTWAYFRAPDGNMYEITQHP